MHSRPIKPKVLQPGAVLQTQQISTNLGPSKAEQFQASAILQTGQISFDLGPIKPKLSQKVAVSQAQQISFNLLGVCNLQDFQASAILQADQTSFDPGEAKFFQLPAVAQAVEISSDWGDFQLEDLQIREPQETQTMLPKDHPVRPVGSQSHCNHSK